MSDYNPIQDLGQNVGVAARGLVNGIADIPAMAGDSITDIVNNFLPNNWKQRKPSEVVDSTMTSIGMPVAKTQAQQLLQSATSGLSGGGVVSGTAGLASKIAPALSAASKYLGQVANPSSQMLSGLGSGIGGSSASIGATQAGASPLVQQLAGLAGGVLGSATPTLSPKSIAWSTPQQKVSSASTSISYPNPELKSPVIFSALKDGKIELGPLNADIGGGKYDQITDWLKSKGIDNRVWDRFNRSSEHNNLVQSQISGGKSDTATISNVLNVIPDEKSRAVVIASAWDSLKNGGKAYFSMYAAPKSGEVSGKNAYQVGMKSTGYVPEIESIFGSGNVVKIPRTDILVATKNGSLE